MDYLKINKNKFDDVLIIERDLDLKSLKKENVNFLIFSRNEQTSDIRIGKMVKKLKVGYSSFSGIDKNKRIKQMQICFKDLLHKDKDFTVKIKKIKEDIENEKTFTLIFDVEQLGGVKFGLPRIIKILNKYKVPSTFFVTNFVFNIYPKIFKDLSEVHEIGLHGLYHEFLNIHDVEKQKKLIFKAKSDFEKNSIKIIGANYIGRMNEDTLKALKENGIKYFVYPLKNTIKFLSVYCDPFKIKGMILVPIFAETYNKNWWKIKQQIDNTLNFKENKHIQILMHPFYDGVRKNIQNVEKVIKYSLNRGYKPITLKELIEVKKEMKEINNFRMYSSESKVTYILCRLYNNLLLGRKLNK